MKVLLVVVDGAAPRVIGPAIQVGRLPVLGRLVDAGIFHDACTTIFPSITPAATTSIVTGEYPAGSGVVGASWYDEATGNLAYYGDDLWVVAREGFRAFLDDFLLRLNGDRISAPTLFEVVEAHGARAACLNYLVYKGLVEHEAHVPAALRLLPGVGRKELVLAPSIVAIGDFVHTRTRRGKPLKPNGGLLHRFGMDDGSTAQLLLELAEDGAFPDFTVAYFADNDYRSHEVGPHDALDVVARVDQSLGRVFDALGGIEQVLRETFVIVTSDHGHCEVLADRDAAAIALDRTLGSFRQATLGKPWTDADEIMICPNMRAAQVYFQHPNERGVRAAVDCALADSRVEFAIFRSADPTAMPARFSVESAKGQLTFWRGSLGLADGQDAFGNDWSWDGDLAIVAARAEAGRLTWSDYPNAFERIAGVLEHPHSATLWFTAKPGCEFAVPGADVHLGGSSHGGLHALESYCLFIAAGPERVSLPAHLRIVDIAPLCLQLLGIPSRRRVGDPRGAAPPDKQVRSRE